jgi:hypothetical protein
VERHGLDVMPPWRTTAVAAGHRREREVGGRLEVVLPRSYAPAPTVAAQAEFALKHEGVNLEILSALFAKLERKAVEAELAAFVRARPTGRYARVLWYLYEQLTGRRLTLPDVSTGNFVPVLDPDAYFTGPPRRSRRHRVLDNQLGDAALCPVVRRTARLRAFVAANLAGETRRLLDEFDEDALRRAVDYLYTKETRSSFGIEGERPSPARTARYVAVLRGVEKVARLEKATLVELQNETVDPRFADGDYRRDQVYVGEQVGLERQRIHFVAPRPTDVPSMMAGLVAMAERLAPDEVDPVVAAAAISFAFVFVHPFSDGNGRLHRLLVHWALSRAGWTPPGVILPVSAVMLDRRREYDACLESFSTPLMERVEYRESAKGVVTVMNDTARFYRYFDATPMAEALYGWLERTIRDEFRRELGIVVAFREAREELARVVDLPDRLANLFIAVVARNGGTLTRAKRASLFAALRDDEVRRMETVVAARIKRLAPPAVGRPRRA